MRLKRMICMIFACILMIGAVLFSVRAAGGETAPGKGAAEEAGQPRLNKKVTIALENTWTDIHVENNWLTADLTVANHTTSSYDVQIRIVSSDHKSTLCDSETIASGSSGKFSNLSAGGYIIQGKSADDVTHEYTLTLSD